MQFSNKMKYMERFCGDRKLFIYEECVNDFMLCGAEFFRYKIC